MMLKMISKPTATVKKTLPVVSMFKT